MEEKAGVCVSCGTPDMKLDEEKKCPNCGSGGHGHDHGESKSDHGHGDSDEHSH